MKESATKMSGIGFELMNWLKLVLRFNQLFLFDLIWAPFLLEFETSGLNDL